MIKKRITIITETEATRHGFSSQLQPLLEGYVDVESYATDTSIKHIIKSDLVLISSKLVIPDFKPYIDKNCPVILARRSININSIDKLFSIPQGTKVLLVNANPETTLETIELLQKLGINHISYIPYYPGCTVKHKPEIAVTPAESELVPSFIKGIIDLGPRTIDLITVVEILERLDLLDEKAHYVSAKYLEAIISLGKQLYNSTEESNRTNDYLVRVLNQLNDGIISFTYDGKIIIFNEKCEIMLKLHHSHALGKNIDQVIKDQSILDYLSNNDTWEEQIFKLYDTEVVISKFRVEKLNATCCTIKDTKDTIEMEMKIRKNLFKKGHVSKYRFEDIIGDSDTIKSIIETVRKLSKVDLSILIQGESGTGKELFAGAIHNESKRANGPFLAVNFSALPEDLVESELFGYEEGAFTGAKKGGKTGLFEQANNGTIFLDEIGDISLKIQARLLRVLQEKEIMRVGGTEIIPVNVRIIAATNKNLSKMCCEGKFREDLYYRLKKLYFKIPPLKERKEDLPLLIQHFLGKNGRKDLKLSEKVLDTLIAYDWPGNVRELENTIEYMVAVCEADMAGLKHLPQDFFQYDTTKEDNSEENIDELLAAKGSLEEFFFIMEKIYELNKSGKTIGRKLISQLSDSFNYPLTEEKIRFRVDTLAGLGLLGKCKGRSGMHLTLKGMDYVRSKQISKDQ